MNSCVMQRFVLLEYGRKELETFFNSFYSTKCNLHSSNLGLILIFLGVSIRVSMSGLCRVEVGVFD